MRFPAAPPVNLLEFVLEQLPAAPARVLEVGCGRGELTLALAGAGYDMTGIDPEAPGGAPFRVVTLEEFSDADRSDAVVASRSLHHIDRLDPAMEKIAELLVPGGLLVVNEFAWERVDEPTADWYYGQRDILAAARGHPLEPGNETPLARWRKEHGDLHRFADMRRALDAHFEELHFSWLPYFYDELAGVVSESLERTLIEAGAIQPIGFRYVGTRG